ncbi:MAG: hypothetical protein ABI699_01960 [Caldimonas sp.]
MSLNLPPRPAAQVVKNGVSLGLLGEADRALVLALAASSIDAGRDHREAEVNRVLPAWLAGPGAMLRTDHVCAAIFLRAAKAAQREAQRLAHAAARRDKASCSKRRAADADVARRAGSVSSSKAACRLSGVRPLISPINRSFHPHDFACSTS